MGIERARPPEIDWKPLDPGSYSVAAPEATPSVSPPMRKYSISRPTTTSYSHPAVKPSTISSALKPRRSNYWPWRGMARPKSIRQARFRSSNPLGVQQVTTFAELMAAIDAIGAANRIPPCQLARCVSLRHRVRTMEKYRHRGGRAGASSRFRIFYSPH